jgi:diaminopimelate decarboxylase
MNDHDHNNSLIQKAKDILTQETARLPESDLQAYVAHYFRKGRAFIETISMTSSPVYVFEKDVVGEKTSLFRKAFEAFLPDTGYYYAVKSNNSPELAAAILETGFGLDVSSGVELTMALALGATDVVFSGPGKNDAELELAVMNSDKVTVLMDSFGELARLGKIAEAMNRTVRTGVRLTTDPKGLWRKFGILTEDLGRFIKACDDYPYIDFKGLQFHSSWNMGPERQIAFIEHLGQCLGSLPEQDRNKITFIDIGGGYWPECGEWIQLAATEKGQLEKALGADAVSAYDHYLNPSTPITVFAEKIGRAHV